MTTGIYSKLTGYHNRKSVRLKGYDYSRPGYYFITLCVCDRSRSVFGKVFDNIMIENQYGKIVREEWGKTAAIRPYATLDEFVVMPNHVHGIIRLAVRSRGTARRAPTKIIEQFGKPTIGTLPTIIRSFKSAVSKRIHESDQDFQWQRSYYEHIIRDEKTLYLIRRYIRENPAHWPNDLKNHVGREIEEFKMAAIGGDVS